MSKRKEYRKAHLGDEIYKLTYTDTRREKERAFYHRDFYHGKCYAVFIKNNPYVDFRYDCLVYDIREKCFMEKHTAISLTEVYQHTLYWVADDRSSQYSYDGHFYRVRR